MAFTQTPPARIYPAFPELSDLSAESPWLRACVLHLPFPPAQPCQKITVWTPAPSVVSITRGDPTVHRSPTTHDPSFTQLSSSRAACKVAAAQFAAFCSSCEFTEALLDAPLRPPSGFFETYQSILQLLLLQCLSIRWLYPHTSARPVNIRRTVWAQREKELRCHTEVSGRTRQGARCPAF